MQRFGVLVFDQVEELDFVGPWEMLTMWSKIADGPAECVIVAERDAPVQCAKGLSINPHVSFDRAPAFDALLIPGGMGTRREVDNPALIQFVQRQAKSCQALLSVCTGSFILQAAGLLEGRRATTHWGSLDRLRVFSEVTVVEQRYVNDGPIWCSAGVSAGIDMMLAFIAATAGEAAAAKTQFGAEYFPDGRRYGDPAAHPQAPAYVRGA